MDFALRKHLSAQVIYGKVLQGSAMNWIFKFLPHLLQILFQRGTCAHPMQKDAQVSSMSEEHLCIVELRFSPLQKSTCSIHEPPLHVFRECAGGHLPGAIRLGWKTEQKPTQKLVETNQDTELRQHICAIIQALWFELGFQRHCFL